MGVEIDRVEFAAADYDRFGERLTENLSALRTLLSRPSFGVSGGSLGAELEMYIVDHEGRPLSINREILERAEDPQLTLELNRYNLEYNLSPCLLNEQPFFSTEGEILEKLESVRAIAAPLGGRIVPIGILPTLRESDFGSHCITDFKRFHALVQQLIKRRGSSFGININGEDPLKMGMADITLEGANTSFQIHYAVNPAEYADTFNAVQLMTPLALAIAANSPTLFGHRLWQETRIPLFKQSIDTRQVDRYGWSEPARVNFGHGWVRRSAFELFDEVAALYPPLLPVCSDRAITQNHNTDEAPKLAELRLHQSTVWLWNRPVYDDVAGGHLRIEMRALPAGPTAVDMVANAALLIGLAEGVRHRIEDFLPAIPFHIAEYNFYRAAQYGLDAQLVWPRLAQTGLQEQSAATLLKLWLPVAKSGLDNIGIDSKESDYYLGVIERRLANRQTGANWQLKALEKLGKGLTVQRACQQMLELFHSQSIENLAVSDWRL